jgi:hypothetical protein
MPNRLRSKAPSGRAGVRAVRGRIVTRAAGGADASGFARAYVRDPAYRPFPGAALNHTGRTPNRMGSGSSRKLENNSDFFLAAKIGSS